MYNIAIVEDELLFSNQLKEFLKKYESENSLKFKISVFNDGKDIVDNYEKMYDVILLDIEMPKLNGMEAARYIRKLDADVAIMFITNMANYAINGYEVGALDFVMKPINYESFSMRMTRVLKRVKKDEREEILLTLPNGVVKLEINKIYYIEVQNRMLHYHTSEGEIIVRGTMQSAQKQLEKYNFIKCNHWYMVNLKYVKEIRENFAVVENAQLEISRRNRTTFLTALTEYMGGTK